MKRLLTLCLLLIFCRAHSQTYHCGTIELQLEDASVKYGSDATVTYDRSKSYEITYINLNGTYSRIYLEPCGLVYFDKKSNMRFYLIAQDEVTHEVSMISVRDDGKIMTWSIKGLKEYNQLNASINE